MMSVPELPEEYRRQIGLIELAKSLSLAEVRCLTWQDLRTRLIGLATDDQAEEVIRRVQEVELTQTEALELTEEVRRLALFSETLRGEAAIDLIVDWSGSPAHFRNYL